jgi:ankyrin repeat protein
LIFSFCFQGENKKMGNIIESQNVKLLTACMDGRLDRAKLALEKGADVNIRSTSGYTPLDFACICGHFDVVKLLFDKGARVQSYTVIRTLIRASQHGYLEIVKLLVENGVDVHAEDDGALYRARTLEVAKYLLEHGANARADNHRALREASIFDFVKLFVEHGADPRATNGTTLEQHCNCNRVEIVDYLVRNGAGTEDTLVWACKNGHIQIAKHLVEHGVNVFLKSVEFLVQNKIKIDWDAQLEKASETGDLKLIEILLENGADIHTNNDAPLLWACSKNNVKAVKYLLKKGADPKVNDNLALRWAYKEGYLEVVKCLMENGAVLQDQKPLEEGQVYKSIPEAVPALVRPSAPPPEYTEN